MVATVVMVLGGMKVLVVRMARWNVMLMIVVVMVVVKRHWGVHRAEKNRRN